MLKHKQSGILAAVWRAGDSRAGANPAQSEIDYVQSELPPGINLITWLEYERWPG
jgi:hypothetical protein